MNSNSYTDNLANRTAKRLNTSNLYLQKRYEKFERSLQKQQEQRQREISNDQMMFLRSTLIFRHQMKSRSKPQEHIMRSKSLTSLLRDFKQLEFSTRVCGDRKVFRERSTHPQLVRNVSLETVGIQKPQTPVEAKRTTMPSVKHANRTHYKALSAAQVKEILKTEQTAELNYKISKFLCLQ